MILLSLDEVTSIKTGSHIPKEFNGKPLKMMKNVFHFMLKTLFVLKYLSYCADILGHVGKQLHKKAKVNFKIYDTRDWETNNYSTHIAQYLKK